MQMGCEVQPQPELARAFVGVCVCVWLTCSGDRSGERRSANQHEHELTKQRISYLTGESRTAINPGEHAHTPTIGRRSPAHLLRQRPSQSAAHRNHRPQAQPHPPPTRTHLALHQAAKPCTHTSYGRPLSHKPTGSHSLQHSQTLSRALTAHLSSPAGQNPQTPGPGPQLGPAPAPSARR